MLPDDLLQLGIKAAQEGDHATASKLLVQVVQSDPNSEPGWLWLGYIRSISNEREYCFRKVLQINPNNSEARQQIEILQQIGAIKSDEPKRQQSSRPEVIAKPQAQREAKATPRATSPQPRKSVIKKRRKDNKLRWFLLAGAGTISLTCLAIFGYFLFQQLNSQPPLSNLPPPTTTPPDITPTANYAPVFETSECQFEVPEDFQVSCGYMRVPEDRNGNLSDTIQLAVAIYHSKNGAPKPDPVLYLHGGSGGRAIDWSAGFLQPVISAIVAERDFIVFDPRGSGYSKPALECDEILNTYLSDVAGKIPADLKTPYYQGAFVTCKSNFDRLDINPTMYTSLNMAADVRDILRGLGYQQANLYGIAYGTRIAQIVMREYPEIVRSAMLDSVVPVDPQMLHIDISDEEDRLLHQLFAECKADAACSSTFPDLEQVYNDTIILLNDQPERIWRKMDDPFRYYSRAVDGSLFHDAVIWRLSYTRAIADIPNYIHRIHDGDFAEIMKGFAPQFLVFEGYVDAGTFIAIQCHEQVFAKPAEGLDKTIFEQCGTWGIQPSAGDENEPLQSDIPTLILAGRYDTITPAMFARQLSSRLTQSYLVEFPYEGHAVTTDDYTPCPSMIVASFLQDPNTAPDLACMNELQTITFNIFPEPASVQGLEGVILNEYNLFVQLPPNWEPIQPGVYAQDTGTKDVNQIYIQRDNISEAEWVEKLRTNFLDGQGFDQPAVKIGDRQATTLAWALYQTSSHGNPVDIAFTKYNNDTIMVLLITSDLGHDWDYDHVFLPAIDWLMPLD